MALDLDARTDTGRKSMQENEIRGSDALELASSTPPRAHAAWQASWPKLAAVAIVLAIWQLVAISGWKASYVLPGPAPVLAELGHQLATRDFWRAVSITMTRGVIGFVVASVLGLVLGVLVARSRILRDAIGSLITGLQTMPCERDVPVSTCRAAGSAAQHRVGAQTGMGVRLAFVAGR